MIEGQTSGPDPQEQDIGNSQKPTPSQALNLVAAKLTDVGRARPHNEDFVEYYIPPDPQQRAQKGTLYLVADGMGGHQAGEVASQGAVESVIAHYYSSPGSDVGLSLVRALHVANQQIHAQAQADPSKSGMGTTLVAAVIVGRKVYIANVGDSRAYLINQSGITQITEDHSWVEEQVRAGLLTPEKARKHPQRNLVTRALGSKSSVEVDLFEGEVSAGDTILLCSDGLTGRVGDQEIAAIVQAHRPEEAVRLLVAQANERGGNDNITVLVVSAQEEPDTLMMAVPKEPARRSWWIPVLLGGMAILALVLGGLAGIRFLLGSKATATPTAPAVLPTTTVTPSPEATLTSTETPSPSPTETATGPTATLVPTSTDTAQPETSDTPAVTIATEPPTSTAELVYLAPILSAPPAGARLSGKATFAWQWDQEQLPAGFAFDLRIWSSGEERSSAKGAEKPTDQTDIEIDLQYVPVIEDYGFGDYYWTVVVVWFPCYPSTECQPKMVSEWGEERPFTYAAESP